MYIGFKLNLFTLISTQNYIMEKGGDPPKVGGEACVESWRTNRTAGIAMFERCCFMLEEQRDVASEVVDARTKRVSGHGRRNTRAGRLEN